MKTLCDYHSTANLNYMIVQLKKVKLFSQILALIEHIISDCNWLINNLFDSVTDESFVNIVKTMSCLYSQSEDKGQQNFSDLRNNVNSFMHSFMLCNSSLKLLLKFNTYVQSTWLTVKTARLKQCDQVIIIIKVVISLTISQTQKHLITYMCLFCFKNLQCLCAQQFQTTDSLYKHYCMIHFQYQMSAFLYLILSCNKIILNLNYFVNHAVMIHKLNLRVRAFIMKV